MSTVVALGELVAIRGYGLAGVTLEPADDEAAVERAWERLPDDVSLLIVTRQAEAVLRERWNERPRLLRAVLPP
jgi:vacuolar-type H+-ATPase subunit F/Vma7